MIIEIKISDYPEDVKYEYVGHIENSNLLESKCIYCEIENKIDFVKKEFIKCLKEIK